MLLIVIDPLTAGDRLMSWNYRIVMLPSDEGDVFVIREVFYDDEGKIMMWSDDDASPIGETFEEIENDMDKMAEALDKPILLLTEGEDGEPSLVEIDE